MPALSTVGSLEAFADEHRNTIVCEGNNTCKGKFHVEFWGSGNTLILHPNATFRSLNIIFENDGAVVDIGSSRRGSAPLCFRMRLGLDCRVSIGDDTTQASEVFIAAAERTTITVGNDVMFASRCELRSHDAHAIYSIHDGSRVNISEDITIGDHVWMAVESTALSGARIGNGSVIGYRSLVTSEIPNNTVAVGIPARAVRYDIAWERPILYRSEPKDKSTLPASYRSAYWSPTSMVTPATGEPGNSPDIPNVDET